MEIQPELIRGNNDRVIGHACGKCGLMFTVRQYGDQHKTLATQCCLDRFCPDCNKPMSRYYKRCSQCQADERRRKFQAKEETPWDGSFPVCLFDDDRYFFDIEALADYVEELEEGDFPELEACSPVNKRDFSISEHLEWDDDRFGSLPGEAEIDDLVNTWIREKTPPLYESNGRRITEQVKAELKEYK